MLIRRSISCYRSSGSLYLRVSILTLSWLIHAIFYMHCYASARFNQRNLNCCPVGRLEDVVKTPNAVRRRFQMLHDITYRKEM